MKMYPLIQKQKLSNSNTKIIAKWSKIMDKGVSSYSRLYGPQFLLQLSGSDQLHFRSILMQDTLKLHMGNFTEERFIDIFKSKRYSRIMEYIASTSFDARTMMGTLPITLCK